MNKKLIVGDSSDKINTSLTRYAAQAIKQFTAANFWELNIFYIILY